MFIKKPLLLCIFLFVTLLLKNTIFSYLLFIILICIQFKNKSYISILLIVFIYFYSMSNYTFFNHIVLETHQNYVIASIDHEKVLIYTDEPYFFGERVVVQSKKEEIESLSNFYIFNFKEYMNKMNIHFYYNHVTIEKKSTIQRRMYEIINTFDDEVKQVLLKILYQFDTKQNIVYSSGMHFSMINEWMIQFFSQFFTQSISILFGSFFLCGFGILFPFKFSLFRILIKNMIQTFMKDHSKKDKIGVQYLICLFFFPNSVYSMSFTIPFLLQVTNEFVVDKKLKKQMSKLLLIFIQFIQTNTCSLLTVLFFPFFRSLNSICFTLSLIQILIKIPFIHFVDKINQWIETNVLSISIHGHVHTLILLGLIFHYLKIMNHQSERLLPFYIMLLFIPLQGYFNPFYQITFLNVGQGDSILIQAPFQLDNTLIDIPKGKENIVLDTLQAMGIQKIDHLIFTHSDSDHNGGKENFINQFKVKNIIENKEDIPIYHQTLFQVNQIKSLDDNDQSIVLFGRVGKMNVCFMGDASTKVEKDIIEHYDYTCDVLKVGHHGSQTSTDPFFIQNVEPEIAIISAGKNNYYGHPHQSVLDTLNRYYVKIYQTKNGAIQIKNFLMLQIIKTSEGEFDIILL